ncbi:MAG: DUF4115 domain-containing protein [Colwellia sp.]|uniref:RodZ domain-containing protein n=1 Tax=Colwellia sp. TaxID=56799 RepID=UPI0025BA4CFA|nr:RodZ domain-containing protein [Colwellia sp.]NQZ26087.1 DUF4115 domain-containing protein [Colwellia sp.]
MINDLAPTGKPDKEQQSTITEQMTEQVTELSEDMEMVSPGAMLREARKALSLSQEHISSKLNFKVDLVNDIENDIFSPSTPVTFIRGYLVNYAKLVAVEVEDILASYDALDAASIQRSEMLSFSNETTKQAEHSRVMWLSYLIVAVLVGLTVLWWQQESSQQAANPVSLTADSQEVNVEKISDEQAATAVVQGSLSEDTASVTNDVQIIGQKSENETLNSAEVTEIPAVLPELIVSETAQPQVPEISTAVFTFKGDCWVNIYDATGERIAWGVKKAGYVMTIQGKAPLSITVGKPELTSIVFNGKPIDMSAFDDGNIAKFKLPIIAE